MSEKKRLHPITIVTNTFSTLKDAIFPIILTVIVGGGKSDGSFFWDLFFVLILPLIVMVLLIVFGVISWMRFNYRLEEQEIRIEHGVFIRKKRYIPCERIQSISTTEGMLQRLFGLVKLTIETAGGSGEAEAVLAAISKHEANEIQLYIKHAKEQISETEEANEDVAERTNVLEQKNIVFRMSFKEIFILAISSGGALGVIAAVFAFCSHFDELVPYERLYDRLETIVANGVIIAIFMGLLVILFAYCIAIIRTMIKYAYFSVEKTAENLVVSHGLLEKQNINVPLNRIQGIIIEESIIRKLFGLATVSVINAGSFSNEGESGKIIIFPLIKTNKIAAVMEACLSEYQIEESFAKVPARAKSRYILRPMIPLVIPVGVGIYFLHQWGLLLLLSFPLAAYFGYLGYLYAGWNINQQQLVLRSRFINAKTVYMFKNRIQSLEISSNFLQDRKRLGSVSATVMSGLGGAGGETVDIDREELFFIYSWYSRN
ncbi:PH domain-containing protein [Caldibacillus lycopersici]|uniref:PH domain-containing protein n=1 Tax=Perspicuibacillus lycopersici TaxID=1325689 RepID=A0AAE3IVD6_9BACI|nr:PH domain-containing protein [Perspicuibacillus lycopersici]MCU9615157.1 PH domain-containing protein [Perspicuibacillus lycopersici]